MISLPIDKWRQVLVVPPAGTTLFRVTGYREWFIAAIRVEIDNFAGLIAAGGQITVYRGGGPSPADETETYYVTATDDAAVPAAAFAVADFGVGADRNVNNTSLSVPLPEYAITGEAAILMDTLGGDAATRLRLVSITLVVPR